MENPSDDETVRPEIATDNVNASYENDQQSWGGTTNGTIHINSSLDKVTLSVVHTADRSDAEVSVGVRITPGDARSLAHTLKSKVDVVWKSPRSRAFVKHGWIHQKLGDSHDAEANPGIASISITDNTIKLRHESPKGVVETSTSMTSALRGHIVDALRESASIADDYEPHSSSPSTERPNSSLGKAISLGLPIAITSGLMYFVWGALQDSFKSSELTINGEPVMLNIPSPMEAAGFTVVMMVFVLLAIRYLPGMAMRKRGNA